MPQLWRQEVAAAGRTFCAFVSVPRRRHPRRARPRTNDSLRCWPTRARPRPGRELTGPALGRGSSHSPRFGFQSPSDSDQRDYSWSRRGDPDHQGGPRRSRGSPVQPVIAAAVGAAGSQALCRALAGGAHRRCSLGRDPLALQPAAIHPAFGGMRTSPEARRSGRPLPRHRLRLGAPEPSLWTLTACALPRRHVLHKAARCLHPLLQAQAARPAPPHHPELGAG